MKSIQCRVVNADDDEVRAWAELSEIDENLIRRDLTPAQRAKLIAKRKGAYEAVHPETKKGGDRRPNRHFGGLVGSFAKDTAAKSGKPLRTVERDITRGRKLGPDLDRVTGTSLDKGAELDALAKMRLRQLGRGRFEKHEATPNRAVRWSYEKLAFDPSTRLHIMLGKLRATATELAS